MEFIIKFRSRTVCSSIAVIFLSSSSPTDAVSTLLYICEVYVSPYRRIISVDAQPICLRATQVLLPCSGVHSLARPMPLCELNGWKLLRQQLKWSTFAWVECCLTFILFSFCPWLCHRFPFFVTHIHAAVVVVLVVVRIHPHRAHHRFQFRISNKRCVMVSDGNENWSVRRCRAWLSVYWNAVSSGITMICPLKCVWYSEWTQWAEWANIGRHVSAVSWCFVLGALSGEIVCIDFENMICHHHQTFERLRF